MMHADAALDSLILAFPPKTCVMNVSFIIYSRSGPVCASSDTSYRKKYRSVVSSLILIRAVPLR